MRGGLRLPARQHRWEIGRVQQGNRPRAIAEMAVADDPVTFGVASPGELIAAGRAYRLRGLAECIACPTLVCEAAQDPFWQGQPKQLYDAVTCPKT